MKTYGCLILLGAGLLLSACADDRPGERLAGESPRTHFLEARVDSLRAQNVQLVEEARMQQAFLESYTRLINQTLASLDAITLREGMLHRIRLDMEDREAGGFTEGVNTIEERIQDNLESIELYIAQSQEQRRALTRQRDELRRLAQNPRVDVTGMEDTIRRLNDLVAEKERTIVALRAEAEGMLGRIAALKTDNTKLVAENEALRQAYFVVDTREELARKDIIDVRRGFLRIGRRTRIDALDARHFQTVDVDTREVYVGEGLARYQVLSNHQQQAALFGFEERAGKVYLSIPDPEAFWRVSRYLVIEVKR